MDEIVEQVRKIVTEAGHNFDDVKTWHVHGNISGIYFIMFTFKDGAQANYSKPYGKEEYAWHHYTAEQIADMVRNKTF